MNTGHRPLIVSKAPQIWHVQDGRDHVSLPPTIPHLKPGDCHFLGHSGGNLENHHAISLNGLSGLVSHSPCYLSYLFLFLNHHHHSVVSGVHQISRIALITFTLVALAPVSLEVLPGSNTAGKRAVTEGRWRSWQIEEHPLLGSLKICLDILHIWLSGTLLPHSLTNCYVDISP